MDAQAIKLVAAAIEATPFQIPGAQGEFRIQILNEDQARGVVTTIVHLPPGGVIPAHRHQAGAEMHYVLEGDLTEAGQERIEAVLPEHVRAVVEDMQVLTPEEQEQLGALLRRLGRQEKTE